MNIAANSFEGGMSLDIDSSIVKMNTYLKSHNIRILSTNNDNFAITNIDGFNEVAALTPDFIPIAVAVYNNVCFIISRNEGTSENEIGTFPSPKYNKRAVPVSGGLNIPTGAFVYDIAGTFEFTYKPLLNLELLVISSSNGIDLPNFIGNDYTSLNYGDFRTTLLNYDFTNKLEVELQRSFDDSVNIIITDNKNSIRIINSLFAIHSNNTYEIVDRVGEKDSNIYTKTNLLTKTKLIAGSNKLMNVIYKGLLGGGKLKVGNYIYYFLLSDAEGNETPVIARSGVCSVFLLNETNINKTRGGIHQEETNKTNSFTLKNVDTNYAKVAIYFSYSSSDSQVIPLYYKINSTFTITSSTLEFTHTGFEIVSQISGEELRNLLTNVEVFKTITQCQDYLFGANTSEAPIDYEELKAEALKFIAVPIEVEMDCYGLDNDSNINSLYSDAIDQDDASFGTTNFYNKGYHNPKNIYYHKGYFGGEAYAIGVIFIFKTFKESPVFPIIGLDNESGLYGAGDLTDPEKTLLINGTADWVSLNGLPDANPNLNIYNRLGILRFPQRRNIDDGLIVTNSTTKTIKVFGIRISYPVTLSQYLIDNTIGCYFVRADRKANLITQGNILPTYKINKEGAVSNGGQYSYGGFSAYNLANPGAKEAYAPIVRTKVELGGIVTVDESSNFSQVIAYQRDGGKESAGFGVIATGQGGHGGVKAWTEVIHFLYKTSTNVPSDYASATNLASSLVPLLETAISLNNFCFLSTDFLMNVEDFKSRLNKEGLKIVPLYAVFGEVDLGYKYNQNNIYGSSSNSPGLLSKIISLVTMDKTLYPMLEADASFVEGGLEDTFNKGQFASSDTRTAFWKSNEDAGQPTGWVIKFIVAQNKYNNYIGIKLPNNSVFARYFSDIINWKHDLSNNSPVIASFARSGAGDDNNYNGNGAILISGTNDPSFKRIFEGLGTSRETAIDGNLDTSVRGSFSMILNIYGSDGFWTTQILQSIYQNLNDLSYFPISQKHYWNITTANEYNAVDANILIVNTGGSSDSKIFYNGDCFINSYFHQLYKNASGEFSDFKQQPIGRYVHLINESLYNSAFRNDSMNVEILGKQSSFEPFFTGDGAVINNYYKFSGALNNSNSAGLLESNYFNKGFYFLEYIKNLFLYPIDFSFIKTKYPNRIYHSLKNVPNQFINNYKTFLSANYKDYDNKYGEIVHIENFNNSLIVFMEHAIGKIAVNQRVQTGSDTSGDIFIKPSEVLSPIMNIVNFNYGTRWQSSIVKSDNYFYCVDVDACKILQISNEGVRIISDFVIQSFLKEYLNLFIGKILDVCIVNVSTHFDRSYNEIRFNFYDLEGSGVNFNIIYNENLKLFVCFYDYNSNISFNLYSKHYSFQAGFRGIGDDKIFEHNVKLISNVINKNKFYDGELKLSIIKFIVNDNYMIEKVFDNLQIISNHILPLNITYYIQGAKTRQTVIIRRGNNIISANASYREEKGYIQIPNVVDVTNKDIHDQLTELQSNVSSLVKRGSRFKGKSIIIEIEYQGDKEIRLNKILTQYRTSNS